MARFTADTARLNAQRSVEARRRNAAEREAAAAQAPEPPLQTPFKDPLDQFSTRRLQRVREQLERLDDMISEETDPQKLDKLASAQSRMAEQERLLAGRPLPGSLRPTESGPRRPGLFSAPAPEVQTSFEPVSNAGQEQE
jgi:hypothetical protein